MAAVPLVKSLQAKHANLRFVITTTTPTGSDRVRSLFGETVFHVYAPYDLNFVLRRFLKKIQPDLLILMETELWPNTIAACQQQGIKILLANARLSEKSALGYRRIASLSRQMLSAVDAIAAQSQQDVERLVALGAERNSTAVTGSLKFYLRRTPISVTGITNPFFLFGSRDARSLCLPAPGRRRSDYPAGSQWPDGAHPRCACLSAVIRNGLIRWLHSFSRICSSAQEQVESIGRKRRSCWATLWAR